MLQNYYNFLKYSYIVSKKCKFYMIKAYLKGVFRDEVPPSDNVNGRMPQAVIQNTGVPMQPLGDWMCNMAHTVAAMSVMWVSCEVSPGLTCHPMKINGI